MTRRNRKPAKWIKDGALVWYHPVLDEPTRYAFVVRGEPWQLGHGAWVVRLRGTDPAYTAWRPGFDHPSGGVLIEALKRRKAAGVVKP